MNVIHKQIIHLQGQSDVAHVHMPEDLAVVHVLREEETVTLWYTTPLIAVASTVHQFSVVGTGEVINDQTKVIHTYFDRSYVWHVTMEKIL